MGMSAAEQTIQNLMLARSHAKQSMIALSAMVIDLEKSIDDIESIRSAWARMTASLNETVEVSK